MISVIHKTFFVEEHSKLVNKATTCFSLHYPDYTKWMCNEVNKKYQVLYYMLNDKAIAYLLFLEGENKIRVSTVFVEKEYRRIGAGTNLIRSFRELVRYSRGNKEIWLTAKVALDLKDYYVNRGFNDDPVLTDDKTQFTFTSKDLSEEDISMPLFLEPFQYKIVSRMGVLPHHGRIKVYFGKRLTEDGRILLYSTAPDKHVFADCKISQKVPIDKLFAELATQEEREEYNWSNYALLSDFVYYPRPVSLQELRDFGFVNINFIPRSRFELKGDKPLELIRRLAFGTA